MIDLSLHRQWQSAGFTFVPQYASQSRLDVVDVCLCHLILDLTGLCGIRSTPRWFTPLHQRIIDECLQNTEEKK